MRRDIESVLREPTEAESVYTRAERRIESAGALRVVDVRHFEDLLSLTRLLRAKLACLREQVALGIELYAIRRAHGEESLHRFSELPTIPSLGPGDRMMRVVGIVEECNPLGGADAT